MREAVPVTRLDVQADRRAQEEALTAGVGAVQRKLDLIEVAGEQAVSFLDGQLSQNVAAIPVGESAWSFVLQPQGKVVALVRVTVLSAEHVLLDTDSGHGQPVLERLNRFKLRVKAEMSCREVDAVSVRGPAAGDVARPGGWVVDSLWPAMPGWDHLDSRDLPSGAVACSAEVWEAVRIRAGLPVNGAELVDKTIPAESGLVPVAASMTKGCYVGQELVARIDSRGHVNRHLRSLAFGAGDATPPPGAELFVVGDDSGKGVGQVTSSASSSIVGGPVALGYLRREVAVESQVIARWMGGEATAVVEP